MHFAAITPSEGAEMNGVEANENQLTYQQLSEPKRSEAERLRRGVIADGIFS